MKPVPLIAVDIGNSSTKVGWFESGPTVPVGQGKQVKSAEKNEADVRGTSDGDRRTTLGLPQPASVHSFPTGEAPPQEIVASMPVEPIRWRVVSVNREGLRILTEWVRAHRPQDDLQVLNYRDLPLTVRVDFPDRVGPDRLAAVVAANRLREPGRPAIVVGAGTAVTVDLVGSDGGFEGGVILAGFRMQAEALFGKADMLPLAVLAPQDEPPPVLGKNTEAAIRSGLFWGAVGAVREIAGRMSANLEKPPQIFVTGGDLKRLAPLVGPHTRYVPNLVLSGIAVATIS